MCINRITLGGLAFTGLLLISACKNSEFQLEPLDDDGVPPAAVSNIAVENLNGGARISYTLPADDDLLYILAECETANGKVQAKSSLYSNSVLLEGFGNTDQREVTLYAVDRGENRSEPMIVSIKPLTPPAQLVRNSVEIKADFGGVNISFLNELEEDLVISVLTPDSLGDWAEAETWYTSQDTGAFTVRGYDAEPREFAVFVRDKWENFSDTLMVEKVPLYEQLLDKSKFEQFVLNSDASSAYGWVMPRMWDDNIDEPNGFHTVSPVEFPHHFTFDLGGVYKLSRYTMWQRGLIQSTNFLYGHGNPRRWELWGATDPASDGSWDGWTKLVDCESIKPSGSPLGTVTNEDREYAMRGHEFQIPLDAPSVRYIRIKVFSTWGGAAYSHVMELSFWGAGQ